MQIAIVFRKGAMVSVCLIWIFFNMLAQSDCDAWTYSMTIKDETHQLDINECISVYDQIQAKIAKKKTKPKFKAPRYNSISSVSSVYDYEYWIL